MSRAIGVDLGTTNTLVSYIDKNNSVKTYRLKGEKAIPSAIYLISKDKYVIGEEALTRGISWPEGLVENFKYNIGETRKTEYIAENGDRIALNSVQASKILLEEILKKVTTKIIKDFNDDIGEVIITVPAKFNPIQKKNTKRAAENAGFQTVKLAKESTAAAIAYIHQNQEEVKNKLLVYDFGGGTFDVSIIEKSMNGYKEVVTPAGDRNLGGNLITKRIADYIIDKIEEDLDIEICKDRDEFDESDYGYYPEKTYIKSYINIYHTAESLKKKFSEIEDEEYLEEFIQIFIPKEETKTEETYNYNFRLSPQQFNKIIEKDIDRTIEIVKKVVEESGVDKNDLDIILTGGSSLLSLVQIKLEIYFDREIKVYRPDTLISEGAAFLTENINGLEMESNLPNDIGVKISQRNGIGLFEPLLKAGTAEKNANVTRTFTLFDDDQTNVKIQLYERDILNYPNAKRVSDEGCSQIDELDIALPNGLKKDSTDISLNLQIDNNGTLLLNVSLHDRISGQVIKDKLNVTFEEMVE